MSDDKKSFLDGQTLIAVVLMMIIWFGWQSYMSKKYPAANKPTAATLAKTDATPAPANGTPATTGTTTTEAKPAAPGGDEKTYAFDSPELSFKVSNKGMGLKEITVKKYLDRHEHAIVLGAQEKILPFQTSLKGQQEPVFFNVTQVGPNEFKGVATVAGGSITKTIKIDSSKYIVASTTDVAGTVAGVTEYISDVVHPGETGSRFMSRGSEETLMAYGLVNGKSERMLFEKDKAAEKSFTKASVIALGPRYFTQAIIDTSPVMPDLKMTNDSQAQISYLSLDYPLLAGNSGLKIENKFFMGPKGVDVLKKADASLEGVVDFGMFSIIAYPILDLLKLIYAAIHNWGFAIIVLTLLVRAIVMPFNIMSYKSMKAMQIVQPEINRIKEKYKDDKTKLNQEMMLIMRENRVNPLGGCLPMLLQFPVFLALYQVLNNTIELYRAPFIFWIHDLSLKDPYYVLPLFMGITMFIQQRITPTTMDSQQAKVMMIMPVIFTFLMISLPSGLTLYIFVSTLFGIIQQMLFMRDKRSTPIGTQVMAK